MNAAADPAGEVSDLRAEVERLHRTLSRERDARRQAEDIAEVTTTRLYQAVHALEEEHRSRRELTASAAHDLKNPIAALSGFTALLRSGDLDGDLRTDILRRMAAATEYTNQMMDGLFEVLRSGSSAEPPGAVDLDPLLANVTAELAARHPLVRVRRSAEGIVWGRHTDLRRLFDNLAENAARYAGHRDVQITFATAAVSRRDVTVMVGDDGKGVAPGEGDDIFQIFRRGRSAEAHAGHGVGLAVCRGIARAAGGDVWLDDHPSPDGGAAFMVRLPVPV